MAERRGAFQATARIRGPGLFGAVGERTYRKLRRGDMLILEREPGNPVDPSAIIVRNFSGAPVGYVCKIVAARAAPRMDSGELLLARVSRRFRRHPRDPNYYLEAEALIYSGGTWDHEDAAPSPRVQIDLKDRRILVPSEG